MHSPYSYRHFRLKTQNKNKISYLFGFDAVFKH